MTAWPPADRTLFSGSHSLTLTAGEDDRPGVEIGMVVVDGELWVRAYRGVGSRWYRAAREAGRGTIRVAGTRHEVGLEAVDEPAPAG
ncbi:DUF2255 family protein [Nocardia aurantia]|uniref:DUF2255 family protein n=1 Tax=Nocardia aurantia TaxID=2585199 RepID=A0A7K0DYH7_9NOCA|nr:DUF2255 family protein [Nocardia aurantia]MQY30853.1 hypothetical protein [Nocardia aurantia]